ncbi:hypothetical protein N8756_07135, partial [Pseudomonadales bacterium]|nr:hypothetical protein [Pseudomonadales bacterium]
MAAINTGKSNRVDGGFSKAFIKRNNFTVGVIKVVLPAAISAKRDNAKSGRGGDNFGLIKIKIANTNLPTRYGIKFRVAR